MPIKANYNIRLKLDDKIYLAENLAIMLRSGVSISETLAILEEQARGKLKTVIHVLSQGINSGQKLSESLSKFKRLFSSYFINSVMSGEASGNLENNLSELAGFLKKEKDLGDKVRNAMIYPLFILTLGFVIATVVTFVVLPKITPIFKGLDIDLPLSTRALIWLAELIEAHGVSLVLGLIIGVSFASYTLHTRVMRPFTHYAILRLPIISNVSRNRNIAICCHTLAVMLKSGLSLDEALSVASNTVSNHYYKNYLIKVRSGLNQGVKFSECLESSRGYFPAMAIGLVKVGERSGNLETELENIGELHEKKVETATRNLATSLEPILLIMIGLGVGWLALSIITPIYKITGNINS